MKLIDIGVDLLVKDLRISPYHFRKETAEENLDALAGSIEQVGLIHAVSTVKSSDGSGSHQLINGIRRKLAHERLGLTQIRANVYEFTEEELADEEKQQTAVAQFLLAANSAEPLLPLERARYYKEAMEHFGMSVEELSKLHSRPVNEIVSDLKWLNLSSKVTDLVAEHRDKFSDEHLRIMVEWASPEKKAWRITANEQEMLARKVVDQEDKRLAIDPKELEKQIRQLKTEQRKRKTAERKAEREKNKEEVRRRQPLQVIKDIVGSLNKVEAGIVEISKINVPEETEIELIDKRAIIEQCYRLAEGLTSFAEQNISPLRVKRVALEATGAGGKA